MIKRELLGSKWVGNPTRQLTLPRHPKKKREPQVGKGLFGVHLLIIRFKYQFSKSIKDSDFSQFNRPFEKKYPALSQNAQKSPKNLHKTAKQCMVNDMSREIYDLALLEM